MRKKKSKAPIVILIIIILVAGLGIAAWNVLSQVNIITQEARKIVSMDITKDSVDTNVYSKGNYAVVEATMKSYIATYLYKLDEFENVLNQDTFNNILSVDNLKADSPDFTASLQYLESKRDDIETFASDLSEMNSQEKIDEVWAGTGLNSFYKWIFDRMMIENITMDFYFSDAEIEEVKADMLDQVDKKEAVINFLAQTSAGWTWEGDSISFADDSLLQQYTQLINSVG